MSPKRFNAPDFGASVMADALRQPKIRNFRFVRIGIVFILLNLLHHERIWSQCALSCRTNVQIALSQTGQTQVTPAVVLQGVPSGCGALTVELKDSLGNSYGDIATCALIGKNITATVRDAGSGNSCWTRVYVKDNIPPVLQCTDQYVFCNQPTAPSVIGYPNVSDNCSTVGVANLAYSDVFTDLPCNSVSPTGVVITAKIKRTWTAADAYGNVATCFHYVYLRRATLADVQFPDNLDDITRPGLQCGQSPTDLTLVGSPMVVNIPIDNAGFCELAVSYTDQIVPICGTGSYKILRQWRVIDWCASQYLASVQIIKIKDTQAPTVSCPASLTANTRANDCQATVTLPAAMATDNCSAVTITATASFGNGLGPFTTVATGVHTVTYTAKDACNNSSTCTMSVTVVDNKPPIAVCNQYKEVALGSNGQGLVNAVSFDNGSHDNCQIQKIRVSRDSINFDSIVNFTCADIGRTVMVAMRVYDNVNLTNDCMINVSVKDKINPAITCPPNITINCVDDFTNTTLTGLATATDNCSVQSVVKQDITALNACNEGIVTRTWTAKDPSGNTRTCQQIITKIDTTPVTIVFPQDYIGTTCGGVTDTSVTGYPVISGNNCELIAIAYFDQTYPIAMPACFKIVRNWQVIDWCKYVPNSNSNVGIWTYQQVIKILDNTAPVLTPPADLTVGATGSNCDAAAIVPLATATDCSNTITITNNSPYATVRGADASGTYPPGTHTITYTASDGCGNVTTATTRMLVRDSKPPTPVCLNGISIPLQNDGTVTLTKNMIESGASNDNCTPYTSIQFNITPTTFGCNELGYQIVKLTATDLSGNSSFCTSTVFIQDNSNACQFPNDMANISGAIVTETGIFTKSIDVSLNGAMTKDTISDANGAYMFGQLPKNSGYNVKPHSNGRYLNGVTTFDLVLIRKHILGVEPLNSPYKIIAADINKSGTITTFDMVELRKLILAIYDTLPNNSSWRFVDAAYTFSDPTNPFVDNFPEQISIGSLGGNVGNKNLIAVKIGDVDNSADAANTRSSDGAVSIEAEDEWLEQGKTYRIPLKVKGFKNISGFQGAFKFDSKSLKIKDLENKKLSQFDESNIGWLQLERGILNFSWDGGGGLPNGLTLKDGEIIFELQIEAKTSTRLSSVLQFSTQQTPAEAYANDGALYDLNLQYHRAKSEVERVELYQNQPNPFAESTTIGFHLPEATNAKFEIFDLAGRLCKTIEDNFSKGYNELTIRAKDLPYTQGVFYYRLQTAQGATETKKLILQ